VILLLLVGPSFPEDHPNRPKTSKWKRLNLPLIGKEKNPPCGAQRGLRLKEDFREDFNSGLSLSKGKKSTTSEGGKGGKAPGRLPNLMTLARKVDQEKKRREGILCLPEKRGGFYGTAKENNTTA